jgi:hypothetical protein
MIGTEVQQIIPINLPSDPCLLKKNYTFLSSREPDLIA